MVTDCQASMALPLFILSDAFTGASLFMLFLRLSHSEFRNQAFQFLASSSQPALYQYLGYLAIIHEIPVVYAESLLVFINDIATVLHSNFTSTSPYNCIYACIGIYTTATVTCSRSEVAQVL